MPTYDYRCGACGKTEERFLPISKSPPVTDCPECGKPQFQRLITGGIHRSGGSAPGCRVSYPVQNFQLPVAPGQTTDTVVTSRRHLNELAARHDYRIDQ